MLFETAPTVVFASNYFNHHQSSFCQSMYERLGDKFTFVQTQEVEEERKRLGWGEGVLPLFVKKSYDSDSAELECKTLIDNADIVIIGSAQNHFVENRIKSGKLVLRYSERQLKKGLELWKYPYRYFKWHKQNPKHANIYLLCASAYTASDYAKFGLFKNRCYKWGYFPETKHYQMNALYEQKDKQKILWVGRFLDWKHPDDVLRVAKRLKEDGYRFSMDIAGTGEMEQQLKDMSEAMGLNDCVTFLGPIPSNRVRELMEKAGIYLFTSDRYEGWGAVLNESMNSGCAVVASHAIGAVPYLMRNRENGLIYHSGNVDELYKKVKYLLDNPGEQERLGKAAYETIVGEWNAEVAAERLINLSEHLLAGEKYPDLYRTGPCSRAEIVKDDWFYE